MFQSIYHLSGAVCIFQMTHTIGTVVDQGRGMLSALSGEKEFWVTGIRVCDLKQT
jgi:hypothetical protein